MNYYLVGFQCLIGIDYEWTEWLVKAKTFVEACDKITKHFGENKVTDFENKTINR